MKMSQIVQTIAIAGIFAFSCKAHKELSRDQPTFTPLKNLTIPEYTFDEPKPLLCATGPIKGGYCSGLLFADINNDGKTDLITTDVKGTMTLYLGTGSGKPFAAGAPLKLADGSAASIPNGHLTAPSPQYMDINNDGKKDLIVGASTGHIYWLKGGENGFNKPELLKDINSNDVTLSQFQDLKTCKISSRSSDLLTYADNISLINDDLCDACRLIDWNKDGKLDLLLLGRGLYLRLQEASLKGPVFTDQNVLLRDSTGKVIAPWGADHYASCFNFNEDNECEIIGRTLSLSDWDADGLIDIIFTRSAKFYWNRNVGDNKKPSYAPESALDISIISTGIEFFDVDNDGVSDLVTASSKGEFKWRKRKIKNN